MASRPPLVRGWMSTPQEWIIYLLVIPKIKIMDCSAGGKARVSETFVLKCGRLRQRTTKNPSKQN